MKRYILLFALVAGLSILYSCKKYPVDDDGLLITDNTTCYMSSFNLLGSDNNQSVLVTQPSFSNGLIDTINLTVKATARLGTNLKKVKPYCGLGANDMLVEPFMGEWTDFTMPRQYTLVSGDRKIRKTYTITITLQQQ